MANEVQVVGGGIGGLVAAIFAARGGARVQLFESVSQVGGRARTRDDGGFLFDMGPHALYAGSAGRRVLDELGVPVHGHRPPVSGALARCEGRLHALPGGFVSLLTTGMMTLPEKLETGRMLALLPRRNTSRDQDRTLSEVLAAELRHPRVRQLVRALVRVTSYCESPDTMSAGAAFDQVRLGLGSGVLYLDDGWQQLVDGLTACAREAGVAIRTGARVRAVESDGTRVCGLRLADGSLVPATSAVLAVPPSEVSSLVAGGGDPLLRSWAEAAPVRAASLEVGLSSLPLPGRTFCLGIDEPTYYSVHSAVARRAPEGAALLYAARYLAPDEKPDRAELQQQLEGILDQMQPGWRARVVCQKLLADLRVTHAVVTAAGGGLAGRPPSQVRHRPGLFVAGDWVGPEGQLADASFASGREAGVRAAGARELGVAA